MYEFTQLDLTSLPSYNAFIPQEILKQISALPKEIKLIIFGATQKSVPLGVCIASLEQNILEILHLAADHQNLEIATTLLSKTQEEAIRQGANIFTFAYPLDTPESPMIEKVLEANHWKGTRPFLIRGLFNPATFNAPIMQLNVQYPPGYKEFLWKNLKPRQRKDLLHREQQKHFSPAISPFSEEKILEPLNSLGLEHKGRVVGWAITHRVDPDTIRYSSVYVEPDLKLQGLATKLLADSMAIHIQNPTKWATVEVPYLFVHPSWVHFFEKNILPAAIKITRYQQGWHTIP
jgi:GNAT superfamily N-acetyltransferase